MLSHGSIARLVGAAALMAVSAPGHANLVANGSFEQPETAITQFLDPGSTYITGWTTAVQAGSTPGTNVQISDNLAFGAVGVIASDGDQYLDLTGFIGQGAGVVSDGFSTLVGATYRVSFDVGAFFVSGYGSYGDAGVDLYVDNLLVGSFTNAMSLQSAGTDWERFSHDFAGTGNAMTIGLFSSIGPGSSNLGVGLDNVVVEQIATLPSAVPEPASWAMMIGGLGLTGMALRTRRTKTAFA